ncbi:MAG: hypothetical protein JSS20_04310 [Proteobacteria bacterium]|nr:hypothetical protein [Pseudomonadota bacterium]
MDYRELDRLTKDAVAVRNLARLLKAYPPETWTEWEIDFLASMAERDTAENASMRQCEVLLDMRDNARSYSSIKQFSVRELIERTWLAHVDLEEDDEEFVRSLRSSGATTIKRRAANRLLRCAHQVDAIHERVWL